MQPKGPHCSLCTGSRGTALVAGASRRPCTTSRSSRRTCAGWTLRPCPAVEHRSPCNGHACRAGRPQPGPCGSACAVVRRADRAAPGPRGPPTRGRHRPARPLGRPARRADARTGPPDAEFRLLHGPGTSAREAEVGLADRLRRGRGRGGRRAPRTTQRRTMAVAFRARSRRDPLTAARSAPDGVASRRAGRRFWSWLTCAAATPTLSWPPRSASGLRPSTVTSAKR